MTTLPQALALVREAQALIERADALLVGYRHYSEHTDLDSWPAEDGTQVSALRDALDAYQHYISTGVRVPVSRVAA